MILHREVTIAHADKVVEVIANKVFLFEKEVVGQREIQVMQRIQVDNLRVHFRQIRSSLDTICAIITTSLGYIYMQISNVTFVVGRDIYTRTVLRRVSLVDKKAIIFCHSN